MIKQTKIRKAKEENTLTIFTDASYTEDLNDGFKVDIGTYSFIIKSQNIDLKKSGVLKSPILNSNVAEIKAIKNALLEALTYKDLPCVDYLIVYTDNIHAIDDIFFELSELGGSTNYLLKKLAKKLKCKSFVIRHVKAHDSRSQTKESISNDWCDKEAYRVKNIQVAKYKNTPEFIDWELNACKMSNTIINKCREILNEQSLEIIKSKILSTDVINILNILKSGRIDFEGYALEFKNKKIIDIIKKQ